MPLKYFNCEAGRVDVPVCLEKCPKNERCLSIPTLHELAKEREYKPPYVFSTTQLINPTRIEYLKITKPYGVNPKMRGFALLGTRHHSRLEAVAKKIDGLISEQQLGGEISGILDLLEPNEDGTWTMIDYKTSGCYQVRKLLDNDWSSGYDLQLNNYRVKAGELGFEVTSLYIQYTARDGNTRNYRENGLSSEMGLIKVPIIPDDKIREYFTGKDNALRTALERNVMPEMCDYESRWGNRRCLGYCDVVGHCPEGSSMKGER